MAAETDGNVPSHSDADIAMMRRCISLSATSAQLGELPFAALICKDGDLIAESTNRVVQSADITRHAELAAISEAQKILGRADLNGCTLYSIVEPCAMCSFAVRETSISRVVFSINSPIMGGLSKWNVLRDVELSHALPEVFGPVPEVVVGLLRQEAEKVWQAWNPDLLGGHQEQRISGWRAPHRAVPSISTRYPTAAAFCAACLPSIEIIRPDAGRKALAGATDRGPPGPCGKLFAVFHDGPAGTQARETCREWRPDKIWLSPERRRPVPRGSLETVHRGCAGCFSLAASAGPPKT